MFKKLAVLQWKAFTRSSSFGKSLGIKIFMALIGLMLLLYLIGIGVFLYFGLRKIVPTESPLWVVNQYLVFWFVIELLFRYFLQKLPVLNIKPYLIANVPKKNIVHYVLTGAATSGFNLFAVAVFLPFSISLISHDYPPLQVWSWFFGILFCTFFINFLNFLINKNNTAFYLILSLGVLGYLLNYYQVVQINQIFGPLFNSFYAYPTTVLVPFLLLVGVYYLNYKQLRSDLYLDRGLKGGSAEITSSELAWTQRFGDMAPFLRLDLRLIWRNKRTKTQVWISLLFAAYGLFFYTQEIYKDMVWMHIFLGLFMTGIFMSNFGQFIPAWDSAYFGMMMSQNIPLKKYLESKALLITVSIVVMAVLTVPYVFFGYDILAINLAAAVYNLGINTPLVLYFGSFNKKRIDLDKSPFANTQGTSAVQFLIVLPLFGLPMLMFGLLNSFVSFEAAMASLIIPGVIGLLLRKYLMNIVTQQFASKKHQMLAGFKESNS